MPKNLSTNSNSVVGSKPKNPGFRPDGSPVGGGDPTRHNYQGETSQTSPTQTMEQIQRSVMQATEAKMHNSGIYEKRAKINRMSRPNQNFMAGMAEVQQAYSKAQQASKDFDNMAFQTNKEADVIQDTYAKGTDLFSGRDKTEEPKVTESGFDESTVAAGAGKFDKTLSRNVPETPDGAVLHSPEKQDVIHMPDHGAPTFSENKPKLDKPVKKSEKSNESVFAENQLPVSDYDEKDNFEFSVMRMRISFNKSNLEKEADTPYDENTHFSPRNSCRICVSSRAKDSSIGDYLNQNKREIIAVMGDYLGLPDASDASHDICVNSVGNRAEIMVNGFDLSSVINKFDKPEPATLKDALVYAVGDRIRDYGDKDAGILKKASHLVNKSDFEDSMQHARVIQTPIIHYGEEMNDTENMQNNAPAPDPSYVEEKQVEEGMSL